MQLLRVTFMKTNLPRIFTLLFATLAIAGATHLKASADVLMPICFTDDMVLQRRTENPVWGWSQPGEEITVTLDGKSATTPEKGKTAGGKFTVRTKADDGGHWKVKLPARPAGGPYSLTVQGKNTIKLNGVVFGEVWLAAGSSNMSWSVHICKDAKKEIADGNHPNIRLLNAPLFCAIHWRKERVFPNIHGGWQVCTPETVGDFAGVQYFFGRSLAEKLGKNIPIGLIHAFAGEYYQLVMPEINDATEAFNPLLKKGFQIKDGVISYPDLKPFIMPVRGYGIRGALYYTGEGASHHSFAYRTYFPEMMKAWRTLWKQNEFPIYFGQMAGAGRRMKPVIARDMYVKFGRDSRVPFESTQAEMREAQIMTLDKLPNSGMIVSFDLLEDINDCHFPNKQDVGCRFALQALNRAYGFKNIQADSPYFDKMEIKDGKAIITFKNVDEGLKLDTSRKAFAISGADRKWFWAEAKLLSKDKVVVNSPKVKNPIAVRYAWDDAPNPILYSKGANLPASPFRTDSYPGITDKRKPDLSFPKDPRWPGIYTVLPKPKK